MNAEGINVYREANKNDTASNYKFKANVTPYDRHDVDGGLTFGQHKTISEISRNIRNQDYESSFLVDSNGNAVKGNIEREGRSGDTRWGKRDMKGKILVHNHPGHDSKDKLYSSTGGSFSYEDFRVLLEGGLSEIRAVSPRYTYSLRVGKNGLRTPDGKKVTPEVLDDIYQAAMSEARLMVKGKGNKAQRRAARIHYAVRKTAREIGAVYTHRRDEAYNKDKNYRSKSRKGEYVTNPDTGKRQHIDDYNDYKKEKKRKEREDVARQKRWESQKRAEKLRNSKFGGILDFLGFFD